MHTLSWTDLQYVLAVADAGSLAAAARALLVKHTTVLRRIAAFERSLGVKLFARTQGGYTLTAAGEETAAAARTMRDTVDDVERRIAGRDLRLTGSVRVTSTDTLTPLLAPLLATFNVAHPSIQLELTTTTTMVNLSKRIADVAVRPTRDPPGNLVGRRVATIAHSIYAAPSYIARVPTRRALDQHTWLTPDDSLAGTSVATWFAANRQATPVFRADTYTTLTHAAAAGLGVVALPCFVGDATRDLQRIRGVIPELATSLWVLTHQDLRGAARIRAMTDHLFAALTAHRDLFEGRRAT